MTYNKKIDGYNLLATPSKGTNIEERLRNVKIIFYSNHEIVWKSQEYKNIPEEKIAAIKEKLHDFTLYNLNEDNEARIIPFFTIIGEIERMIFN